MRLSAMLVELKSRGGSLLLEIFALGLAMPLVVAGVLLVAVTAVVRSPIRYAIPVPGPPAKHRHRNRRKMNLVDLITGRVWLQSGPLGALANYRNHAQARWKEVAARRNLALGCSFRPPSA